MTAARLVARLLETDDLDPKEYAYDRVEPIPDEGWVRLEMIDDPEFFELAPVSHQANGWDFDDAMYTLGSDLLDEEAYESVLDSITSDLNRGKWEGKAQHDGISRFPWRFYKDEHEGLRSKIIVR